MSTPSIWFTNLFKIRTSQKIINWATSKADIFYQKFDKAGWLKTETIVVTKKNIILCIQKHLARCKKKKIKWHSRAVECLLKADNTKHNKLWQNWWQLLKPGMWIGIGILDLDKDFTKYPALQDSRTNSHWTFDHHNCLKSKSRYKNVEIIKLFL